MKCYIGLGSNLGQRKENLERAVHALARLSRNGHIRVSVLYETPALVPPGAPQDWHLPFLNAVAEIEWNGGAQELLKELKSIEIQLGRQEAPRWAPRIIDLDLLLYGSEIINVEGLQVPHPEITKRAFVLEPLKDLAPNFVIPGRDKSVLQLARQNPSRIPWIMAIFNLTPDSFSDGGELQSLKDVENRIAAVEKSGANAIDIGAESTRPHAAPIRVDEERRRLEPVLSRIRDRYRSSFFKPYLSVDTRRPEIAALALEYGADCINDVSGLADPAMLDLLTSHSCDYILMHSLTVPADPKTTLPEDCDPVRELKAWLNEKLERLVLKGISLDRVIFDPGIGFGKTARQSLTLLKRIDEFSDLPLRLLVGHSRKSFLKHLGIENGETRDVATLSISMFLARKGVDILRVHDFASHAMAFKVSNEVSQ